MYGANNNPVGMKSVAICQDYEEQAERLNGRIVANRKFISAIEEFVNSDHFYQLDDRETNKTIFSLYGELKMKQPNIEKEHSLILEEIEKQG